MDRKGQNSRLFFYLDSTLSHVGSLRASLNYTVGKAGI
jgi:hypothetical protein